MDPAVTRLDATPLADVVCTEKLDRRAWRRPDYKHENQALSKLARVLSDAPTSILQALADTILEVTQSDSAGLSFLTVIQGEERFYWPAIAGMWRPHVGGGTPRDFGPCGDVLDRSAPLLFCYPERLYAYLRPVMPPAVECLLIPFYSKRRAVGTIWAIAHDDQRKFDREDVRVMVVLADFASAVYDASGAAAGAVVQVSGEPPAGGETRRATGIQRSSVGRLTGTLSRREREVLSLLVSGHTYGDVAERLSLTNKTVETYRARAAKKLGIRNRAELVAYALRTGILRHSDPALKVDTA